MSNRVLWLLLVLGLIGAFDTLYYHEWRARLPSLGKAAASELKLHALRDFLYLPLFATLPFLQWNGGWALVLAILLVSEVVVTIQDFIVEDWVRKSLGGVFPGERATHALMGIIYGAMAGYLLPIMWQWWQHDSSLTLQSVATVSALHWSLVALGFGVALSGIRDWMASRGVSA